MSSNPAVSIFAELKLLKEKALRDAASFPAEMKSVMKGITLEIPLTVNAANLQTMYDAAVKSITVSPINVPVNFIPGGMPGMGGGGGMPEGAASPNLAYYFGQMQQSIAATVPTSSPNWSNIMGGNGGGAGGEGGGARGMGMFRAMMGIHGILALGNVMERENKEVMERENKEKLDLDRVMTYGSGEEKESAMKRSVKEQYEHIHSNAITNWAHRAGVALGFNDDIDAAMDTDAQADKIDRKTKKMKAFSDATGAAVETAKQLDLRTANTGASDDQKELNNLADQRRKMEKNVADLDKGYNGKGSSPGAIAERGAFDAYEAAQLDEITKRKGERATDVGDEARSVALRGAGQDDEAARVAMESKQGQEYRQRKEKFGGAEADEFKKTVQGPEAEQFRDEQRRKREKAEGDSAARIADIYGEADEKMMHATGATYEAMETATKRHIDDQINQLKRLENEQVKGSKRQLELHNEVIAAQAAGVRTLAAVRTGAGRDAELAERDAGQDLDVANLDAGGQHRDARRKAITDKYENEAQKIIEENSPKAVEDAKLRTAEMRRDAAMKREDSSRVGPDLALANSGIDAAARARGQEGVGGVLAFEEQLKEKYRNAKGDAEETKLVDNYKTAEIAARRRELRPRDGGTRYGGVEYHDILQGQINTSYGHSEALQKLGEAAKINTGNAGTPGDSLKGASKELSNVVKQFGAEVDKMNKRKSV